MLTFQEIYESYSEDIYRFAFSLCQNRQEAEDVTSETFVRAWARNERIRTETLKAYLFAVARNTFLENRRKVKNRVDLEDVYADPAPLPDRAAAAAMELQRIEKMLSGFPEEDRTVFILRVRHDLPYEEIARILQLSLSAVKVKIHRVRKKLILSGTGLEVK